MMKSVKLWKKEERKEINIHYLEVNKKYQLTTTTIEINQSKQYWQDSSFIINPSLKSLMIDKNTFKQGFRLKKTYLITSKNSKDTDSFL